MNSLLIIIPCYNEQENIEQVVNNLMDNYTCYDYIVINDGSQDDTADICRKNGYNLINLPVNLGLTAAVQTGMKFALYNKYDYAIQLDGDGQHDPIYIEIMLEAIQKNEYDLVIGSRFINTKKRQSLRMMGSTIITLALLITTGIRISDPTSGMRMYGKKLIKEMALQNDFSPEPDTIAHMIRSGAKLTEVNVVMNERLAGESYLSPTRAIRYMFHILISMFLFQWFRKPIKLR